MTRHTFTYPDDHTHETRYAFDFGECSTAKGYAQFDTRQDAYYYGHWVNPTTFRLVSYAEGDVTVTVCDDVAEFAAQVRTWIAYHGEEFRGIDPGLSDDLRAAFVALGLDDLLR